MTKNAVWESGGKDDMPVILTKFSILGHYLPHTANNVSFFLFDSGKEAGEQRIQNSYSLYDSCNLKSSLWHHVLVRMCSFVLLCS